MTTPPDAVRAVPIRCDIALADSFMAVFGYKRVKGRAKKMKQAKQAMKCPHCGATLVKQFYGMKCVFCSYVRYRPTKRTKPAMKQPKQADGRVLWVVERLTEGKCKAVFGEQTRALARERGSYLWENDVKYRIRKYVPAKEGR